MHELLEEAAALRELVVPEYMSAHAVGRLLSAPLMSPPQLIRFDWSGRQGEDGEVLEEEQEAEVPLVLEGADEEVLAALVLELHSFGPSTFDTYPVADQRSYEVALE